MAAKNQEARLATFEIDGDSLDALSTAEAFVHGAEWGIVWQKAQSPEGMNIRIQASNLGRVERMLTKLRRTYVVRHVAGGYAELAVMGLS